MVSNSKILTVSYGTFSCTLEGFDEPFNTMKSIAEYFRDLAADDRYFGAEPPTPDAEMLHRIAEREIQKRVETRIEKDGVVLRQADSDPAQQTAVGATIVAADHLLQDSTAATGEPAPEAQKTKPQDIAPQDIAPKQTPARLAAEDAAEEQDAPATQEEQAADPARDRDSAQIDIAQAKDTPADSTPPPVVATTAAEPAPTLGSIAEKLQRIRAVVDGKRAEGETAFVATDQYAEDQENLALLDDTLIDEEIVDEEVAIEMASDAALSDAAPAETALDMAPSIELTDADLPDEDAEPELAQQDDDSAEENAPSQEEIREMRRRRRARRAEQKRAAEEQQAQDAASDTAENMPEPQPDLSAPSDLSDNDGEDTISGVLSRLNSATDDSSDTLAAEDAAEDTGAALPPEAVAEEPQDVDEDAAEAPAATDDLNALSALVSGAVAADQDTDQGAAPTADAERGDQEETSAQATQPDEAAQTTEAASETDAHKRKPRVIRVRHIKGARPEAEASATAPDALNEAPAPTDATAKDGSDAVVTDDEPAAQDNENSMLTPDEEAELMAELAEAEAEARASLEEETGVDENTDENAADIAEAAISESRPADPEDAAVSQDDDTTAPAGSELRANRRLRAFEDGGVEKTDASLDRILAETNSKLESTEVTRRRSAIAHLKAAVQATRAEKEAESGLGADADTDSVGAYRDDLARVVRPRRPGKPETPARRMPPLVLVSEQRIDDSAEKPAEAAERKTVVVRPRRVVRDMSRTEEATETEALAAPTGAAETGFVDYVEETGAHELGELLEAAACHTVLVNGHETFTRPMVMGMVRRYVGDENFSREEGLRAFGKLLREGRIKRLKRGQFELTDSTRFRPGGHNGRPDDRQSA